MIRFRYTTLGIAALIAVSACTHKGNATDSASATSSRDATDAALTVNGTVISQREMAMLVHQQPVRDEQPNSPQKIVDNLTMQILAAQEATRKELDKSPDVHDQMDMSKTSILAQAYIKDFFATHKPTDAQLNAEYDKVKAAASGNEYRARHIVVKTEADAKAIIVKLNQDPKAFSELAAADSLDPVSKAKGGDLGWFDPARMAPEFADAVKKLGKGQISQEPVKSQFGFHVIVVDDIRSKADSVPPFEQIKDSLAAHVEQEELFKALSDLKARAKISVKS
ncbi:peptidylprolyl isomerase [Burkholderia stabilis]|uniref:peptidylprolyl isomerase n=1 Tax=Burkholderia stabilis TaxID=95485 RepID=UPI001591CCE6|nr:peptidylprolyl isomerase [Burkholderia stabilis]